MGEKALESKNIQRSAILALHLARVRCLRILESRAELHP